MRPIRRCSLGALALLGGAAIAAPASAQAAGDPADGRRIAEIWCANCHAIGPDVPGPASDAAPSFVTTAQRPAVTALALRVFLQTPHANMPNYQLSREEVDDVVAYILSLKR
ncbi:c-type cytochrome [Caldovatus aquaticus]|uniref:Cytochrome c n=1 Tax=Caldovatus aquaticus TaxID=2865671 RepID=A0ABS7F079_9PROT|nr:cytochrome c [Caldovatus aquaticus]MBW8268894.1 cytochrome c [Caldovatus aquaticus]